MKAILILVFAALPLLFLSTSCTSSDEVQEVMTLCDCGMEKGTEGCCDAEAPRCDDCGKIKGSPGCCVEN